MKSQMKAADRSGARIAIIVGTNEVDQGEVTLRPLRGADEQSGVPRTAMIDSLRKALS
jgi:histidyl-tRNA synthetase